MLAHLSEPRGLRRRFSGKEMHFYCSVFGSSRAPDVSICITANGLRSRALCFRPLILKKKGRRAGVTLLPFGDS